MKLGLTTKLRMTSKTRRSRLCTFAGARVLGHLASIGALVAAASCRAGTVADHATCERLLDHVVDLRLEGARVSTQRPPRSPGIAAEGAAPIPSPRPLTSAELAEHRHALSRALGDSFVSSCETKLSRNQIDCALAATDSSAATRCTN
jgi:hypothetical protein